MFIRLYTFWSEGYSGLETAQTLGISMTTVRHYDKTIRKMPESKVQTLIDCNDAVTKCVQNRK
jgi:predicted transcriptional regulator